MAEGGYLALNMRDLARRAGVSPGTLYSYFATKEEIFATLYAEAIVAHNARLAPICEGAVALEPFLVDLITAYLDLYQGYGRYFTMWTALGADRAAGDPPADAALPRDLAVALRAATFEQGELTLSTVRRVAGRARGGARLVDQPEVITFVWTMLNGIADHVTSERHLLSPLTADELIAFAARTLAAGLLTPA